MMGFPIMLPMHMQNITRTASLSGGYSSMALSIGILIVSIGFFIFMIAGSIDVFLDAWKKIPDTFKIPQARKPETPDPSQVPQVSQVSQDKPAYPAGDKPPYLWDVRLDAMRRDLDRIHCELKALESRINNRKD